MTKIFIPGNNKTKAPWKPFQRKGNTLYPKYIIGGMIGFFILIMLISVSKRSGSSRQNEKSSISKMDKRPERALPEGKMGDWAKGVVYIEAGSIQGDVFYGAKTGSGFVFSGSGSIMTNYHVIQGESAILITFYDGSTALARVVKADPVLDIANLVATLPRSVIPLDLYPEENVKIGRKVLVMGFPLGSRLGTEMTLTDGIISSVRSNSDGELLWYQISAAVNPGNSGGPLIDSEKGFVLGVVTAKINEADNIGFARPSSVVLKYFPELKND